MQAPEARAAAVLVERLHVRAADSLLRCSPDDLRQEVLCANGRAHGEKSRFLQRWHCCCCCCCSRINSHNQVRGHRHWAILILLREMCFFEIKQVRCRLRGATTRELGHPARIVGKARPMRTATVSKRRMKPPPGADEIDQHQSVLHNTQDNTPPESELQSRLSPNQGGVHATTMVAVGNVSSEAFQ